MTTSAYLLRGTSLDPGVGIAKPRVMTPQSSIVSHNIDLKRAQIGERQYKEWFVEAVFALLGISSLPVGSLRLLLRVDLCLYPLCHCHLPAPGDIRSKARRLHYCMERRRDTYRSSCSCERTGEVPVGACALHSAPTSPGSAWFLSLSNSICCMASVYMITSSLSEKV